MACNITTKSGQCKGLEDILESTVKGKLQGKHGVWIDITYHLIFKYFWSMAMIYSKQAIHLF